MAITHQTANRRPSAVALACIVLALIAAACGVPDDIETVSEEPTLDALTPVAPAADTASDDEASEPLTPATDAQDDASNESPADTVPSDEGDTADDAPEEETSDESAPSTTTEATASDDDGDDDDTTNETSTTEAITPDDDSDDDDSTNETSTTEAAYATPTTEAPETTTTTAAPTTTSTTTTTVPPTTAAVGARVLSQFSLDLELVASLSSPVAFATRPGTSDVFIGEQAGRVVRLPNGAADGADTTLDLRGNVSGGNEQGLLGLAFAPDGQRLYVNYTNPGGSTIIARYDMSGNSATNQEILMTISQPFGNHNGGQLAFGPDGFLYIGLGDGGSSGDPQGNGQNPNSLHGSILRIDVSGATGYTVPTSNPFANGGGAPEVFVWGIRNAWRFGFDSANGDLWIGDVGQDRREEVTVLRSGRASGANLGWNLIEGTESFRGEAAPAGHVGPVLTYAHENGRCSITGGEVYRGSDIPGLAGTYLYGDFCSGEVFGFRTNANGNPQRMDLQIVSQLTSFGIDNAGEVFVLSRGGGVFKIVEA